MNYLQRILKDTFNRTLIVILGLAMLAGLGALISNSVSARTKYDPNGTATSATPVFNEFYDVPNGVGDEADFVRVKNQAGSNADYVNVLDSACNANSVYTVRTYVHNGADPTFNEGTATAIAHNTTLEMNAKTFGQVQKNFVFESTIDASNAASMTDTAELKCGKDVILELVPSSVEIYSKPLGWSGLPDSSVNGGPFPIGSRTLGSGDVYACWDDRVIVVYEVVVKEKPAELHPAVCDNLLYTILSNNQVRVDEVEYTANDATVNSVSINYGDGTVSSQIPNTHTYDKEGEYIITATLKTTFKGQSKDVTSPDCKAKVTVNKEKQPEYACEMFVLKMNDRTANVSFKVVSKNGAVFKNAQISYYADSELKNEVITDKVNNVGIITSSFTYDENAKNVEVVAKLRFNIGEGKDQYTREAICKGKAVLGTHIEKCPLPGKEDLDADDPNCKEVPPAVIPDTGAGSVAGILTAVTAAGAIAHRKLTLRRQ